MLLSCKLSNTVLQYLEARGEDLAPLLESVSLPEEFLKDPSYWMRASDMEAFLEQVSRLSWRSVEENLLQKIAHASPQLRSWGVLDSVLRMMPRPQEILAQPSRFLSNFISPEPPVEKIEREESGLSFDVPISSEKYPRTTEFLKWSFETLPVYVGKELAVCEWKGIRLSIRWECRQNVMFGDSDHGHQVSPDLLRQIVASLQEHQHELERKNSELQKRNEQLQRAQHELEEQVRQTLQVAEAPHPHPSLPSAVAFEHAGADLIEALRHNLSRLTDSFVRAQQLVTLLVGQDRADSSVKEAMRRVNWESVKTQFPKTIEESFAILEKAKESPSRGQRRETEKEIHHV